MKKLTFSQKEIAGKIQMVILVRGHSMQGEPQFAYLAITGDQFARLQQDMQKRAYQVQDYGSIIHAGMGEPTQADADYLLSEYGVSHNDIFHFDNLPKS